VQGGDAFHVLMMVGIFIYLILFNIYSYSRGAMVVALVGVQETSDTEQVFIESEQRSLKYYRSPNGSISNDEDVNNVEWLDTSPPRLRTNMMSKSVTKSLPLIQAANPRLSLVKVIGTDPCKQISYSEDGIEALDSVTCSPSGGKTRRPYPTQNLTSVRKPTLHTLESDPPMVSPLSTKVPTGGDTPQTTDQSVDQPVQPNRLYTIAPNNLSNVPSVHLTSDRTTDKTALGVPSTIELRPSIDVMPAPTISHISLSDFLPKNSHSKVSYAPSVFPSKFPTSSPIHYPTLFPSDIPSELLSTVPSKVLTSSPIHYPTFSPSDFPSTLPSTAPSRVLTSSPIQYPTLFPSNVPFKPLSMAPSSIPSTVPSMVPSKATTTLPTRHPSLSSSVFPSEMISSVPSEVPSTSLTSHPSVFPSTFPSLYPSRIPSRISTQPSSRPSFFSSDVPSKILSDFPSTGDPSTVPTPNSSMSQSNVPSTLPSNIPTLLPSNKPSVPPTLCGLTAKALKATFQGFFAGVLSRDPTPGSPQEQALTWLVMDDIRETGLLCPNSKNKYKLTERYIMAVFYFSLGGDSWNECGHNMQCNTLNHEDPYLSNNDYCNWYGVTCIWDIEKKVQVVTEIVLNKNNLSGTIPNEIGHLSQLEALSLRRNNIVGQIPTELYNHKMLKELLLSNNKLLGTISSNLEQMDSLQKIYLDGNNFTGQIPDAICQFEVKLDCLTNDGVNQLCYCCKFCK